MDRPSRRRALRAGLVVLSARPARRARFPSPRCATPPTQLVLRGCERPTRPRGRAPGAHFSYPGTFRRELEAFHEAVPSPPQPRTGSARHVHDVSRFSAKRSCAATSMAYVRRRLLAYRFTERPGMNSRRRAQADGRPVTFGFSSARVRPARPRAASACSRRPACLGYRGSSSAARFLGTDAPPSATRSPTTTSSSPRVRRPCTRRSEAFAADMRQLEPDAPKCSAADAATAVAHRAPRPRTVAERRPAGGRARGTGAGRRRFFPASLRHPERVASRCRAPGVRSVVTLTPHLHRDAGRDDGFLAGSDVELLPGLQHLAICGGSHRRRSARPLRGGSRTPHLKDSTRDTRAPFTSAVFNDRASGAGTSSAPRGRRIVDVEDFPH